MIWTQIYHSSVRKRRLYFFVRLFSEQFDKPEIDFHAGVNTPSLWCKKTDRHRNTVECVILKNDLIFDAT